jgi:hypothetical protein
VNAGAGGERRHAAIDVHARRAGRPRVLLNGPNPGRLKMAKCLHVPVLVLACLAVPVASAGAHASVSSKADGGRAATGWTASARDGDHDGLPDRWERRHRLSTNKQSGAGDPDHDGLRNRREFKLRLNPRRADTDRDGLRDRAELRRYHTNPRKRDTDGDGFSDRAEIRRGTNPRDPSSHPPQSPSPSPAPAPAPGPGGSPADFPNSSTTGVPAGWAPAQTRGTDLTISTPGAVVQDMLLSNGADLFINAPNVTVRRVKLEGGWISNVVSGRCNNGLLLEDVTIDRGNGEAGSGAEGVVSYGGYTARRVAILNRSEGFRSGAAGAGCTPSTIENSFIQIRPPAPCGDWHGDGIQGYGSSGLIVRNVTIDFAQGGCGGTAGFFYPGGPDGTPQAFADINRLLIKGGPYPFRLGTRGSVQGLKIVNGSWSFGPILITDTGCGPISPWEAKVVEADAAFRVTSTVRDLPCR